MTTPHQELGTRGEGLIVKHCFCPRCKCTKKKSLRRLPTNFKCADVICDFCGYLGQVKTYRTQNLNKIPDRILGAAWGVQQERMKAGIYFPLFLVLIQQSKRSAIYYLSADVQRPEIFERRKPLSKNAKRAGWTGFNYHFHDRDKKAFIKLK